MASESSLVPVERIERRILSVRGHRVLLDSDLAEMYGVPTKRLNEQVKRNRERFPEDFTFQLTWDEAKALRSQIATLNADEPEGSRSHIATLKRGMNIKYRPYAFTEHGAIMAANVLNSPRAIQASVYVVRAFVRLREVLATHKQLAHKLTELEERLDTHDEAIRSILTAIRQLMTPPAQPSQRIGFRAAQEPREEKKTKHRGTKA